MGSRAIGTGNVVSNLKRHYHEFFSDVVSALRTGGAAAGTTGARNILMSGGDGLAPPMLFEQFILGAGQTIISPTLGANGLDIGLDQTNDEGMELTQGITARSPMAFVAGVHSAFYLSVRLVVADVSGCGPLILGFRKAEAHQAAYDDYDEMAAIGLFGADIKLATILNGAATVVTDTTQDAVDATALTLTVKVSSARAVTYEINGAAPTATAAFSFDSGEVVVPFVHFLHDSDVAGTVELIWWDCGQGQPRPAS